MSCFPGTGLGCYQFIDSCLNTIQWNLHTYDTCRADQYCFCRDTQKFACIFCFCPAAVHSLLTRTCIGNPCIYYNSLHIFTVLYDISVPYNRSSLYHIRCKSSRCLTWFLTVYKCHIFSILIFDRSLSTCCFKSFCCGHTTINYLHSNNLLSHHYLLKAMIFSLFNIKS